MKKLDKKAEARLMRAIEKIATLVGAGTAPNDAIVKAANDEGVPAGHINMMVHAYNTGRTTRQIHDGGNPLEKAAEFPMADASTVLEMMYPSQVKTAAERIRSKVVSTEYAIPPDGVLQRKELREKRARLGTDWKIAGVSASPEPYPVEPKEQMRKAASEVQRGKVAVEEARRQVTVAGQKMASTFDAMTDYFRESGCLPMGTVRNNLVTLHGSKGAQIMDQLVEATPALGVIHKRASDRSLTLGERSGAIGRPYDLAVQLLDEIAEYKHLKQAHETLREEKIQQAEVLLDPFCLSPSPSILDNPSSPIKKSASAMNLLGQLSLAKNVLGGAASGMKPPPTDELLQKQMDNLSDPEHDAELRRIQSQATLQELLLNDNEIAGYDPNEALDAYNDVVQASPRAATQRMLLQTLMRKRLSQGQLDQFDVDHLLGMEEKLRKQEQPPTRVGAGDESII